MMKDVLIAMIKAHEIQGVIALENSFNRVGVDHVMCVRIASTAVAAAMLDCDAWLDGSCVADVSACAQNRFAQIMDWG